MEIKLKRDFSAVYLAKKSKFNPNTCHAEVFMEKISHNRFKKMLKLLLGISVCLIVAGFSWFLGRALPVVGAPVFSIFIGILCAGIFSRPTPNVLFETLNLDDGIKFTSKKLLQYSVILLGFEMNLFNAAAMGRQSAVAIICVLTAALAAAFIMGKILKLSDDTVTLIGVGTAICGGSAIAAAASVIRAEDRDVARSVSTIFLFNVAAIFIFPFLGRSMGMSDMSFGMWAGMAINDTSSVVAAGTAWSSLAGNNTALQTATVVKLMRTLAIIPVTLFLAVYTSRNRKDKKTGKFNFVKVFPWFIVFFAAAAVINTFAEIPLEITRNLGIAGRFGIVAAMAGIGLSTNFKSLFVNGVKPILLGLCCWVSAAAAAVIMLKVSGVL